MLVKCIYAFFVHLQFQKKKNKKKNQPSKSQLQWLLSMSSLYNYVCYNVALFCGYPVS